MIALDGLGDFLTNFREGKIQDEIEVRDVQDGIVFYENGKLSCGIKIRLPNAMQEFYEDRWLNLMKSAMLMVPQGASVRFVTSVNIMNDSLLKQYKDSVSTKEARAKLLAEARYKFYQKMWRQGKLLTWNSYIIITQGKESSGTTLMYKRSDIEKLKVTQKRLMSYLDQLEYKSEVMDDQDIFEACYYYYNPSYQRVNPGTYKSTKQVVPEKVLRRNPNSKVPTFRSQVAKSSVKNTRGSYLEIADHYVKCLHTLNNAERTDIGIGNLLLRTGVPMTYILDFEHLNHDEVMSKVNSRNRTNSTTLQASGGGHIDGGVKRAYSEGAALEDYLNETNEHMWRSTVMVVLYGKTREEVEQAAFDVLSEAGAIEGNPFRILDYNTFKLWSACAPFSGKQYNERVDLVGTAARHYLPISGASEGSKRPKAIYHTRSGKPIFVDIFDPRTAQGHSAFIGNPRSGKTFNAQFQLSEELKDESYKAVIIDRGLGWARTVKAYEGAIIKVDGNTSINPFQLKEGVEKADQRKKEIVLELLKAMAGCKPDSDDIQLEESILETAIEKAYVANYFEKDSETREHRPHTRVFTLSDFIVNSLLNLSSIGTGPLDNKEKTMIKDLATRLRRWTGNNTRGQFVDRPTNLKTEDRKVVLYETSSFDGNPQLETVATMLIQNEIYERADSDDTKRLIVCVDEFDKAIRNNPYALALFREILRRGGKRGVALWIINHTVSELDGEGKEGFIGSINNIFLTKLPKDEYQYLKKYLRFTDDELAYFNDLTSFDGSEEGSFKELFFRMNFSDGSSESEILVLRSNKTDYYTYTNHVDDLEEIKRLSKELGSEDAAVRRLSGLNAE